MTKKRACVLPLWSKRLRCTLIMAWIESLDLLSVFIVLSPAAFIISFLHIQYKLHGSVGNETHGCDIQRMFPRSPLPEKALLGMLPCLWRRPLRLRSPNLEQCSLAQYRCRSGLSQIGFWGCLREEFILGNLRIPTISYYIYCCTMD